MDKPVAFVDEKKPKGTLPWIDTGWRREFGGYEVMRGRKGEESRRGGENRRIIKYRSCGCLTGIPQMNGPSWLITSLACLAVSHRMVFSDHRSLYGGEEKKPEEEQDSLCSSVPSVVKHHPRSNRVIDRAGSE